MKISRFLCVAAAALFCSACAWAETDLYLNIQRGEKLSIGFPTYYAPNKEAPALEALPGLQDATQADILFSKLFNLKESGPAVGVGKIDFEGWSKAGADILITGAVSAGKSAAGVEGGQINFVGSAYELPSGKPIFQKKYSAPASSAQKIAHAFVADLLFRFTGDRGLSESQIVFVNDASGSKELWMIDYDGSNLKRLTGDKSVVVLPRWAPDKKHVLYTSYKNSNPDLYLYSLTGEKPKAISRRQGLNSSAVYSPSGDKILLTLSIDGVPGLYTLAPDGKMIQRLTKDRAACTASSYSPDGRKIVYVSDKPGFPQIYMMDSDGAHVERITSGGYCDGPVWSPRGDKLAYSKGNAEGHHDIVLYDLASGKETLLTSNTRHNENPSFSPDGRFIVYSSNRDKRWQLYVVSIDGSITRPLAEIPGNSTSPSWAP